MVERPTLLRRGTEADAGEIAALLTEAAEFARAREGELRWPIPFPEEEVRAAIRQGVTHVLELDGRIAGTVNLLWEDPNFWGKRPPDAGYVHKLAVRRAWAHHGIGRRILEWTADEVRKRGRGFVRLDCPASNERLVRFYESEGYRHVADLTAGPGANVRVYALMERPLEPTRRG